MPGCVDHIHVSMGGVPKSSIPTVQIYTSGLVGDWQKNRKHHGGPDRAVCLFSTELIEALNQEGHPIYHGSVGENLTLSGLDWSQLKPGVQLQIGTDVLLEVTSYAPPCSTIKASFAEHRFSRISEKERPGQSRIYTRVLREGRVTVGDAVVILSPLTAIGLSSS